jgi:cyclophilin family peptidyl-prolyl cis-trans isomerase
LLLPPIHEDRVIKPAAVAMAMAPTKSSKVRFFIFFSRSPVLQKGHNDSFCPLTAILAPYF